MQSLMQKEIVDDVMATAQQLVADFTRVERALLERHRGRDDRALIALLLREIVIAMLGRLLSRCRGLLGTDFADIAMEVAAKAILLEANIDEEPS